MKAKDLQLYSERRSIIGSIVAELPEELHAESEHFSSGEVTADHDQPPGISDQFDRARSCSTRSAPVKHHDEEMALFVGGRKDGQILSTVYFDGGICAVVEMSPRVCDENGTSGAVLKLDPEWFSIDRYRQRTLGPRNRRFAISLDSTSASSSLKRHWSGRGAAS